MPVEQKRYKLSLAGQYITIVSDEPENLILSGAESLNNLLIVIQQSMPTADKANLYLLAALKLAIQGKQIEFLLEQRELQILEHINQAI